MTRKASHEVEWLELLGAGQIPDAVLVPILQEVSFTAGPGTLLPCSMTIPWHSEMQEGRG